MQSFTPEQLDDMARNGTLMNKITVASRMNVKKETLAYLMETEPDDELKLTIMMRTDITEEQVRWAATSESAFVLNRLTAMDKTPIDVVRDIRARAQERTGDVWRHLETYADRVLTRREGRVEGGLL